MPTWTPYLLVGLVCFANMAWQRGIGFGLQDEGFLWYGAQRVLQGELPLRDFQAYDPARYYWSAAWMAILRDDGIVALRWGNAILGAITVALATYVVWSDNARLHFVAVLTTGLIFTLWMVPDYKVSDSFAAMLLIFGLARLLRRRSPRRYFQFGACLGVAATIGINHAFYGCVAALLTFIYHELAGERHRVSDIVPTVAGGIVGYSPVLALHGFAPGFMTAFIDSIRLLFEYGTTNLELPFPGLFGILDLPEKGILVSGTETFSALLIYCVPLLWAWTAWRLRRRDVRAKIRPALLAAFMLSLPYAHYAYSRADMGHIAISVLPVLAWGMVRALELRLVRQALIFTGILGASLVMTAGRHPGSDVLRGKPLEQIDVAGDRLLVRPDDAAAIRAVKIVAAAAGDGQFFAGPYLPGAYAVAERKSPVWEIYMLFPSSPIRQRAEIQRIASTNIGHALLSDDKVDDRRDLGLEQTHPLLVNYLRRCLNQSRSFADRTRMTFLTKASTTCPPARRKKSNGDADQQSGASGP